MSDESKKNTDSTTSIEGVKPGIGTAGDSMIASISSSRSAANWIA